MADEDGFASPFDDDLLFVFLAPNIPKVVTQKVDNTYVFAFWDSLEIDLDFRLCEHIGGCGHADQEVYES